MNLGQLQYQQRQALALTSKSARISLMAQDIGRVLLPDGREQKVIFPRKTLYEQQPLVGDWVTIEPQTDFVVATKIWPRYSMLSRVQSDDFRFEQKNIAANIDTIFLCMSLNANFSLSRLERYLTAFNEEDLGAKVAVVLTKRDLKMVSADQIEELRTLYPKKEIFVTSNDDPESVAELALSIVPGNTVAFFGNSGVGKSTLVNLMAGTEILAAHSISGKTDKGRHTTSGSRLIHIDSLDINLIDTPGVKSVGIAEAQNGTEAFPDIMALALQCKFRDCTHTKEPGCAVRQAVAAGKLDKDRYHRYLALQDEQIAYADMNKQERSRHQKKIGKEMAISKRNYRKPLR